MIYPIANLLLFNVYTLENLTRKGIGPSNFGFSDSTWWPVNMSLFTPIWASQNKLYGIAWFIHHIRIVPLIQVFTFFIRVIHILSFFQSNSHTFNCHYFNHTKHFKLRSFLCSEFEVLGCNGSRLVMCRLTNYYSLYFLCIS